MVYATFLDELSRDDRNMGLDEAGEKKYIVTDL